MGDFWNKIFSLTEVKSGILAINPAIKAAAITKIKSCLLPQDSSDPSEYVKRASQKIAASVSEILGKIEKKSTFKTRFIFLIKLF